MFVQTTMLQSVLLVPSLVENVTLIALSTLLYYLQNKREIMKLNTRVL